MLLLAAAARLLFTTRAAAAALCRCCTKRRPLLCFWPALLLQVLYVRLSKHSGDIDGRSSVLPLSLLCRHTMLPHHRASIILLQQLLQLHDSMTSIGPTWQHYRYYDFGLIHRTRTHLPLREYANHDGHTRSSGGHQSVAPCAISHDTRHQALVQHARTRTHSTGPAPGNPRTAALVASHTITGRADAFTGRRQVGSDADSTRTLSPNLAPTAVQGVGSACAVGLA